jgi:hypothetical protein
LWIVNGRVAGRDQRNRDLWLGGLVQM